MSFSLRESSKRDWSEPPTGRGVSGKFGPGQLVHRPPPGGPRDEDFFLFLFSLVSFLSLFFLFILCK